jgi:NADPH:quinone reductase-like Zn-dependent oxidoreductase
MTQSESTLALGVTEYGGPEVLQVLDLPVEPLGAGELRVRVTAATVNATDTVLRAGLRAEGDRPAGGVAVPGVDIAGILTEIGEDVATDLTVGEHVMAPVQPAGAHGGYRQDVVVPARSVTRVPSRSGDVAASTLPTNGLTARQALDVLGLAPGQVLAVTGAAGAFGGFVVELAKADGVTVIADAAPADEALVRRLGADVVVTRGDDVAERIRGHFPGGVDGLADGAVLDAAALPAVRDGGVVATVRGYTGDGTRELRVTPVWVRSYVQELEKLDQLRELVEQGAVTLRVAETYPAAQAVDAHRRLEAGGVRGRLVLTFA